MNINKIGLFFLVVFCFVSLFSCREDSTIDNRGESGVNKKVENKFIKDNRKKEQNSKLDSEVFGIDISHYQENIDWDKVKESGLSFVFIKATGGESFHDPAFQRHWEMAKKHGLARSAYHFYYSKDDPIKQADFFISRVRHYGETKILPPVVDVEEVSINSDISTKKFQNDLLKFLNRVEYELNRKPMIYCDPSFAKTYLENPAFKNYYLWIADYDVEHPTVPEVWEDTGYTFWQKKSNAIIPGIIGKVDLDYFNGTKKDLENLFRKKNEAVEGIDVSHFQNGIDWGTAKNSGISFAFIKASGGVTFKDPKFHEHWKGARDAGVKCGPYHFYYSRDSPYKQARFFISRIKKYVDGNSLPPVVDVEEVSINSKISEEDFEEDLLIFLKIIKKNINRKPIIYCDPSFARKYLNNPEFDDYYLWIANYGVSTPIVPKVWKKTGYEFWQNSSKISVPGVDGFVDHDIFIGSLEKLNNL